MLNIGIYLNTLIVLKNDHEKETYDTRYGMELSKENFISTLSYGSPQGFPHFILHKDHSNTQVFGIASQNKGTKLGKQRHRRLTSISLL